MQQLILLTTPDPVIRLPKDGRFYFGSNEAGAHGAGAAYDAMKKYGARYGVGFGPIGRSFAIPSKDWRIQTLPLPVINHYVQRAIDYIHKKPNEIHVITKIACGLAGYTPEDIAPMFIPVSMMENVWLPSEFRLVIRKQLQS